ARLVGLVNDRLGIDEASPRRLERVFYTDAGATAVEVAIKMAVGYWRHQGKPDKHRLIVLGGAYHGDTVGAMSAGYSELFHKPYERLVFEVDRLTPPDPLRSQDAVQEPCPAAGCPACSDAPTLAQTASPLPGDRVWPSECPRKAHAILEHARQELEHLLQAKGDAVAAVLIEPVMQGAAGMVAQPPGYLAMVRELCDQHEALLIADEVATGFGRTGKLFACEHEQVAPDILCLAKGLTGGYLPVAATVCTAAIEDAFSDPNGDNRLYHGHTYTGNALGCAVALASLDLWEAGKSTPASEHALSADLSAWSPPDLLAHIEASAELIASKLDALRDPRNTPRVLDVRQRGLMVGIELSPDPGSDGNAGLPAAPQSPAQAVCLALLNQGLWLRPLGDVVILMPAPAMDHANLARLCDAVVQEIQSLPG
ncbi:MAG: aminotransferase class III-fold pyridoxal phosphate-dependent enzyme, partial [Planctomycetota bacterium]